MDCELEAKDKYGWLHSRGRAKFNLLYPFLNRVYLGNFST